MGIKIAGRFFHPAYVSFRYTRSFLLIFINLHSSSSTSSVGFCSSIYAFRAFIPSVIYSLISFLSMVKYRLTSLNFIIKTSVLLYLLQLYEGFCNFSKVRLTLIAILFFFITNLQWVVANSRHTIRNIKKYFRFQEQGTEFHLESQWAVLFLLL